MKMLYSIGVFFLLCSNMTFAVETLGTYYLSAWDEKYEVLVSDSGTEVFISCQASSEETEDLKGGIFLNEDTKNQFIKDLKEAKKYFIKWSAVAKKNKVKDFIKPVEIVTDVVAWYFQGDILRTQSVRISYFFQVSVKGKTALTTFIPELDRYPENHKGFTLILASVSEVDSLIKIISDENIKKFINKPTTDELFK